MEALSLNGTDAAPPLARGRYRLLEELGHGGMATVYRAHDERLSRDVAVKVLNPSLASNTVLRARFVQEAKMMARLATHGHVVQIYDFGQDDDDQRQFIAMELLSGTVQQALERHGPLPPRLATTIMRTVLDVLEAAHGLRVIHRDVKPSNILLTREGSPKVGDFGIARILGPRAQGNLTRTGAGVGTWAYMAPEQKRDAGTVDHRADVYGVGATLFALLTNVEPHDIDRAETWREQLEAIPAPLREIILRATRYQADERYDGAAEMNVAMGAAVLSLPPDPPGAERLLLPTAPTRPVSPPTLVPDARPPAPRTLDLPHTDTAWPPPDLRGRPPLALIVGLGALLTLGVWWLFHDRTPEAPPDRPTPTDDASTRQVPAPPEPSVEEVETVEATTEQLVATATQETSVTSNPRPRKATPSGGSPAPTPPEERPDPPAAVKVPLSVKKEGEASCMVIVDGRRIEVDGGPYYASGMVSAPIELPAGAHTIGCSGGAAQSITLVPGEKHAITLASPTPSAP